MTERHKTYRFHKCDKCAEVKVYEGRIEGFDGTYLDESWRGLEFGWMRAAWENGEIDITLWCRARLSKMHGVRPSCIGAADWAKRVVKRRESTHRPVQPHKRQKSYYRR